MESEGADMRELFRLVRENNRMLHSMRRNAMLWGIVKFLLYVGLLIALPLWLYMTYLAPIVESTMETFAEVQGTGARAQAQFSELQELLNQFDVSQYFER